MSDLWMLNEEQMCRIEPFFPLSHRITKVDDRRIVSGVISVIKHGLMWRDAPQGLWSALDHLQPLHPLEPPGRVQPHLCRACRQGW